MTAEEFSIWINGFLSLTDDLFLDKKQVEIIKNHANLVGAMAGHQQSNINDFINKLANEMQRCTEINITTVEKYAKHWISSNAER